MLNILDDTVNPVEPFLRSDRMPHIWCPGCGIGTTVNSFARALIDSKIDLESLALVSGIGCTGPGRRSAARRAGRAGLLGRIMSGAPPFSRSLREGGEFDFRKANTTRTTI